MFRLESGSRDLSGSHRANMAVISVEWSLDYSVSEKRGGRVSEKRGGKKAAGALVVTHAPFV